MYPRIHHALRSGVSLHLRQVKIKTARNGRFKILISWRATVDDFRTIYAEDVRKLAANWNFDLLMAA